MLCTTLGFYGSSMFNFHIHIQLSIEYALHSSYLYNIHKGQLDNQHVGHARKFYKVWTCGMLVVSLNTGGNTTTGQASRVFYTDPSIRQRLVDMCPLEFRDTYKTILEPVRPWKGFKSGIYTLYILSFLGWKLPCDLIDNYKAQISY